MSDFEARLGSGQNIPTDYRFSDDMLAMPSLCALGISSLSCIDCLCICDAAGRKGRRGVNVDEVSSDAPYVDSPRPAIQTHGL